MSLSARERYGLTKVLNHVASWTSARFDQHLRYEVGDEAADNILAALKSLGVEFSHDDKAFIDLKEGSS